MRRNISLIVALVVCVLVTACGQSQESDIATRTQQRTNRPVPLPSIAATPRAVAATEDDAIRIARSAVSPYIATWQDVIAQEENGIWRVIFRNYDPLPKGAIPNDDYWRVPLSVFVDAATGIVLRQGYL